MKKGHTIFLLIFFWAQLILAQNPFITNYTLTDGLPTNKIFCVQQDRKGFIWFGTDAGVTRFDGSNFVNYNIKDGLSNNLVIRIKEDLEGRVWFLNHNGTVNYFFKNKIHNGTDIPFLDEIKSTFLFHDFFQDSDSTIYLYNSNSEVFVIKGNEYIDYLLMKDSLGRPISNCIYLNKSSGNNFLVWSPNAIYEYENLDLSAIIHRPSLSIAKAFQLEKNQTFTIDQQGYVNLFNDFNRVEKIPIDAESTLVNSVIVDNENYIWISSFNNGVFCYKNNELVLHLEIECAQNLILDRENNIWSVSNTRGIFKINRDILKYKFWGKEFFNGRGVKGLNGSKTGTWATNGNALFLISDNQLFKSNNLSGNQTINRIHLLNDGRLLLHGFKSNLFTLNGIKLNPNKKTLDIEHNYISNYTVKGIAISSHEVVLYSYINDEVIIAGLKNSMLTKMQPKVGRITNLFFNKRNELLINGARNVIIRDSIVSYNNTFRQFDGKYIPDHLILDEQNEIFNFIGNELYLQNNDQFYDLLNNLHDQIDFRIRDMDFYDSTLFFTTVKTVYFITNPLKVLKNEPIELNRLNIEFNNINDLICKDSTLYVASDDGLTFIPVEECVNAKIQPTTPYFYKVFLDDQEIDISSGAIDLKNIERLSIEFSSLNYSSIPSEYSYKMKGSDEHWSTGKETRVVYLNLDPGEYVFQLKSRKNREPYSEVVELPVIVHPTILQRTSTKILIIFILLLLLFLIVRYFYHRKIQQKETDHLLITLEHKALQSMMNPHFIFNALGSIQGYLLQNKSSEAGTYLSQFARLIRQNMNSLKSNYICIDDEVERLNNYIELEKLRLNSRFEFEIEVDEKLDSYDACIPSMIIQPFVENAIWHGISPLNKGGRIKVAFNYLDEKSIEVLVEDNGIGIKNEEAITNTGRGLNMGMTLTKKRLRLIGERRGVQSQVITGNLYPEEEFPGTQIKIIIPLIEAN
uniref:sensor histidine kinase n=1 Tax=uncultured Draconibacterium sp. TaxID=1573823 RepID=UPI0032168064